MTDWIALDLLYEQKEVAASPEMLLVSSFV